MPAGGPALFVSVSGRRIRTTAQNAVRRLATGRGVASLGPQGKPEEGPMMDPRAFIQTMISLAWNAGQATFECGAEG